MFAALLNFSSAACCEKIKGSPTTCQDAGSIDECDSDYMFWESPSCSNIPDCETVTCIYENSGECSPETPQITCIKEGGTPDKRAADEIDICQTGCALFEDGSVCSNTEVKCEQIAMAYGIGMKEFRLGVTDQECYALAEPKEVGACVFEGDYLADCEMIEKQECLARDGDFNEGLLCTAPRLSNCAKTSKTTCSEEKVYFLDSCGNKANVYDSRMFSDNEGSWNAEMTDYWTYIQEPKCSVNGDGSNICGDCDYLQGSTCKEYNRFEMTSEYRPIYGENTCANLGCFDDSDENVKKFKEEYKRYPQHGESWCAISGENEGLNPGIKVNALTGFITDEERERLENGYNKFNLPGSEYVVLNCWDGEVEDAPCDSMRRQVCKETLVGEEEDFSVARCMTNDWISCVSIGNKDDCEVPELDCKWIEGFRFGETPVVQEEIRDKYQGACVPLIAPGFMFWDDSNGQDGEEWCELGEQAVDVLYETHWSERRDNFEKFDLDASDGKSIHQDCLENCYAIPGYGDDVGREVVERIWQGSTVRNLQEIAVSLRKGHYCEQESNPDKKKLGDIDANKVICINRAENQEDAGAIQDALGNVQRRGLPVFYTNSEWLSFLTERTRSLGDCGYKAAPNGIYNSQDSEIITALFQKLTQQLEVKENVTVEAKIYQADKDPNNGLKLLSDNYYRTGGELTSSSIYTAHLDRIVTDGPSEGSSEEEGSPEGEDSGTGFPGVGE